LKTLDRDSIIKNAEFLLQCCQELNIPILVTEHAKRVFGPTVPSLRPENATIIEKTKFSMCCDPVNKVLESDGFKHRKTVILTGIESHICALQTGLELLKNGFIVHYVVDAGGSARELDQALALKRMENAGIVLTTSETIVFQLLGNAKHPKFKTLQKYIKQHSSDVTMFQKSKL